MVSSLTVMIITLMTLLYWNAPIKLADLMPAVNFEVYKNMQLWRVFTSVFIHADLAHLLSNVYMLWIFSFFVFGYFGFSIFPMMSFFLAGVVNAVAILTYAPHIELLGASGLVYILGGFWLTLYFFIQRQYTIMNRLIRVIGIAMMIFLPSTFAPTTSYRTHAIGFLVGMLMAAAYFIKNKKEIRSYEVYKISLV